MARKTLEEKLEEDKRELAEMKRAFAEKERALKLKIEQTKKQYSAAYQKKRTRTFCTIAPIAMYIFGHSEDDTTETFDKIITDFQTVADRITKEQCEQLREIFNSIIAKSDTDEKQAESEKLPKCENCEATIDKNTINYYNHNKDKSNNSLLCLPCHLNKSTNF